MDAKRDRIAARCAVILSGKPLLVDAVTGLMENAEESLREIIFVVTGSYTDIARAKTGAEWMSSDIKPSRFEIKADCACGLGAKFFLAVDRIVARYD